MIASNVEQSDDPREKMMAMMSGGPGGGMGGGPRGGGAGGGMRANFEAPPQLEITQSATEFTVVAGGTETTNSRTFNTDGRKIQGETERGRVEAKAQWKKNKFIVEVKTERGGEVPETYELAKGKRRLYVTTRIENDRFPQPLILRRVYDPVSSS